MSGAFVARAGADGQSLLWIDAVDYGHRLLLNGKPMPWDDVGAYLAFARRLQSLLESDVLSLDLGRFFRDRVAQSPALAAAMGEKRRATFPLRTMLADSGARTRLVELVAAVSASHPGLPLLLELPAPADWLCAAWQAAKKGPAPEIDTEIAETAAMYVADFLRCFAGSTVAGVLLHAGDAPLDPAVCQPLANVAAHYRWSFGAKVEEAGHGFDFIVADHPVAGCLTGLNYRLGAGPPPARPANTFLVVQVDADAEPDAVLEQLAALRDAAPQTNMRTLSCP